jgi:peptide/nickel transport system permease protein
MTTRDVDETEIPRTGSKPQLLRKRWRSTRFKRPPILAVIILGLLVVCALGANWIAPHDPLTGQLAARNLPPFWVHGGTTKYLLGTDDLGRDMLSRMIFGARTSLTLCLASLVLGGLLGTALGLVSGWYGGWLDEVVMRTVDVFLAMPLVLLTLVFIAILGASEKLMVVILVLYVWVRFARVIRGEVLRLKHHDHVALARVAGASTRRILFRHILPGVRNTLIVVATLEVGVLVLLEATLSFLGAGVPPPTPSWGSMVAEGRVYVENAWWISTLPGILILLTVLAFNLVGEWLRDRLDPRSGRAGQL